MESLTLLPLLPFRSHACWNTLVSPFIPCTESYLEFQPEKKNTNLSLKNLKCITCVRLRADVSTSTVMGLILVMVGEWTKLVFDIGRKGMPGGLGERSTGVVVSVLDMASAWGTSWLKLKTTCGKNIVSTCRMTVGKSWALDNNIKWLYTMTSHQVAW